ncbi:phosphotransferase family protein [Gordonia crocea]|uniref:Putative phosphotransferase n=1 Tax=Gordonia crocea TaxID=589162 RepID=A0A7I9UVF3_9ACTN|nr:phosphotransferase family protein [Gordonia crocea]GED97158.1 putative phosphotransferase [Gordonia crocea]
MADPTDTAPEAIPENSAELARPSASRLDAEAIIPALTDWLTTRAGTPTVITALHPPDGNGMSSETVLVDAEWGGQPHHLVARVAPSPDSDPVFAGYDLDNQFRLMAHVADTTAVPIPPLYWSEPSPDVIGHPFIVMGRVDGQIPPDVLPYTFESWLTAADEADRQRLQRETIAALAAIHAAPIPTELVEPPAAGETALGAQVRRLDEFYRWTTRDHAGSPLLERALRWAHDTMPDTDDEVLIWGDARIGNVIYQDFRPVAILDWEMAGRAPRELDVAWGIALHRFFQDIAELAGLPGLPTFWRRSEVEAAYAEASGVGLRDMDFYIAYATLYYSIILFRVQCRAVDFGQAPEPADPDDKILNRATLTAMIEGTYWDGVGENR